MVGKDPTICRRIWELRLGNLPPHHLFQLLWQISDDGGHLEHLSLHRLIQSIVPFCKHFDLGSLQLFADMPRLGYVPNQMLIDMFTSSYL